MKASVVLRTSIISLLAVSILMLGTSIVYLHFKHPKVAYTANTLPQVIRGVYWFQVGVWAESRAGISDRFGEPVTGASVEIRILDHQRIIHPDADLAYWVGINLPNDAFIQVGYSVSPGTNLGKPTWFWEYFPPGTASNSSGNFLGKVGSVVGPNGTWVKFSLTSDGTRWSAYVNKQMVGSTDLKVSDSGTNGPYASAEVAGTRETDNSLGPVEFRNLAYRDVALTWHDVDSAVALCCYGLGSDKLPLGTPYPYGVAGIPGDNNHWIAGSGVPYAEEGWRLWPWYYVTVSSDRGNATGSGWYVREDSVQPTATSQIPISAQEHLELSGWSVNGVPAQAFSFTVTFNMTLTPVYTRQYLVTVTSPFGKTYGSGWYDEGSQAVFGTNPRAITEEGWLGELGVRRVFVGWEGDYSGTPRAGESSTLNVDSPKTIRAVWTTDYGLMPGIALGIVISSMVTMVFLVRRRRSRRTASITEPAFGLSAGPAQPALPIMFCRYCGAEISRDSKFCKECGTKLVQ